MFRVRARKQPGRKGSGLGTPGKGRLCPGSWCRPGDSRGRDASPEPWACGCPSGLSHAERLPKVCVPRNSGTIEPPFGSQVTSSLIEIFAASPEPLCSSEARGGSQGGGRRVRMLSAGPGCRGRGFPRCPLAGLRCSSHGWLGER